MTSYIPISLDDALNGRGVSIFDVLNGRGNHLKQSTGNINYRRLVSANKDLYMKCQERDKIKISMGIVAAVRKNGGRFLAYDGSKKIFYADIGDYGAREKTSQALRDAKSVSPIGIPTPHVDRSKELPQELYTTYSCRVLASFLVEYHSNSSMAMPTADAAHQNESERENSISTFSISLFSDSPPSQVLESRDSTISERDSRISALSLGTIGFVGEALSEHSAYRTTSGDLCKELIDGEKSEKERDSDITMMSI